MKIWRSIILLLAILVVSSAFEEDYLLRDEFEDSSEDTDYVDVLRSEDEADYDSDFEIEPEIPAVEQLRNKKERSKTAKKAYNELKKSPEGRKLIKKAKKVEKLEKKAQKALAKSPEVAALPEGKEIQSVAKDVVVLRKAVESADKEEKKFTKIVKKEKKELKRQCKEAESDLKACRDAAKIIKEAKKPSVFKKIVGKKMPKSEYVAPTLYKHSDVDIFKHFPKSYEEYERLLSDTDDTDSDEIDDYDLEFSTWGRIKRLGSRIASGAKKFIDDPVGTVKKAAAKLADKLPAKLKKVVGAAKKLIKNPNFSKLAGSIPGLNNIIDKGKSIVSGISGKGTDLLNGLSSGLKKAGSGLLQQIGGGAMEKLQNSEVGSLLNKAVAGQAGLQAGGDNLVQNVLGQLGGGAGGSIGNLLGGLGGAAAAGSATPSAPSTKQYIIGGNTVKTLPKKQYIIGGRPLRSNKPRNVESKPVKTDTKTKEKKPAKEKKSVGGFLKGLFG